MDDLAYGSVRRSDCRSRFRPIAAALRIHQDAWRLHGTGLPCNSFSMGRPYDRCRSRHHRLPHRSSTSAHLPPQTERVDYQKPPPSTRHIRFTDSHPSLKVQFPYLQRRALCHNHLSYKALPKSNVVKGTKHGPSTTFRYYNQRDYLF